MVLFTSMLWVACQGNRENSAKVSTTDQVHQSQNSLDWQGTYVGVIPCADCEGIEVKLELTSDLHYRKTMVYLGKGNSQPFIQEGNFSWNKEGTNIQLLGDTNDSTQYKVGENQLIQLDRAGQTIQSEFADSYKLKKIN